MVGTVRRQAGLLRVEACVGDKRTQWSGACGSSGRDVEPRTRDRDSTGQTELENLMKAVLKS